MGGISGGFQNIKKGKETYAEFRKAKKNSLQVDLSNTAAREDLALRIELVHA